MNAKEPWLAVFLSIYAPGAGLIYARRVALGALAFAIVWGLFAFGLWSIVADAGNTALGVILLLLYLPLHLIHLFVTFYLVRAQNPPEWEAERKRNRDPWLAVFLALLFPLLGVLYLRQWKVALLLFVGF